MFNLFEIMRGAQGGAGVDAMARQLSLNPEQAERAVEALIPAFAVALQRSATDPQALGRLFSAMSGGNYAAFFSETAEAFSPQGQAKGRELLAQFFGSEEISRRVAQQAAASAGLGAEVMQRMLPAMAATLVGGMSQTAASRGLGDFFARLAAFFHQASAPPPQPQPAPHPLGPWGEMMSAVMTGGAPGAAPGGASFPFPFPGFPTGQPGGGTAANPFLEAFGRMFPGAAGPAREPEPEPAPGPGPAAPANPAEVWAGLFQTGREVQEQQLEAFRSILDAYRREGR